MCLVLVLLPLYSPVTHHGSSPPPPPAVPPIPPLPLPPSPPPSLNSGGSSCITSGCSRPPPPRAATILQPPLRPQLSFTTLHNGHDPPTPRTALHNRISNGNMAALPSMTHRPHTPRGAGQGGSARHLGGVPSLGAGAQSPRTRNPTPNALPQTHATLHSPPQPQALKLPRTPTASLDDLNDSWRPRPTCSTQAGQSRVVDTRRRARPAHCISVS